MKSRPVAVILNHNSPKQTRNCVHQLTLQLLRLEIIVVDNSEGEQGVERLRADLEPNLLQFIRTNNRGYSAGNNLGIEHALQAGASHILIVNPDIELRDAHTVGTLIDVIDSHPDVGIVAPTLRDENSTTTGMLQIPSFHEVLRRFLRNRIRAKSVHPPTSPTEVPAVHGACWMIRREVFETSGLLDPGFFMYCEEQDLCLRARQDGWKVVIVPNDGTVHSPNPARDNFPGRGYMDSRFSLIRFNRKHHGRVSALLTGMGIILAAAGRAALAKGEFPNKLAFRAVLHLWLNTYRATFSREDEPLTPASVLGFPS